MLGLTQQAPRGKTELIPRWQIDAGDYVTAGEVSRDGRLCVVGTGDGSVLGLDVETGREVFRQQAHLGGVISIAIAPDSSQFASCGQEPHAKVWTISGALVRKLEGGGAGWVEHVAWAPRGGQLATAAGRKVRVWGPEGEPIVETEPMPSTVSGLGWRSDATAIAACCYGGVHIWPLVAGAKARHFQWKGSLISLEWSPDAKVIACASQDCSVHFWRLATGKDSQMSGYTFKPKALAWDSESKLLATAGDATLTVWDFRGKGPEGTHPIQLKSHKAVCTRLAFSPRKGVLASGAEDTSVLLWEPRRSKQPIGYAFLEDEVTVLAWHPEHRGLLGGDASGNLSYWETS